MWIRYTSHRLLKIGRAMRNKAHWLISHLFSCECTGIYNRVVCIVNNNLSTSALLQCAYSDYICNTVAVLACEPRITVLEDCTVFVKSFEPSQNKQKYIICRCELLPKFWLILSCHISYQFNFNHDTGSYWVHATEIPWDIFKNWWWFYCWYV